MPRVTGQETVATQKMRSMVYDSLKQQDMTVQEMADHLGITYALAYLRMNELKKSGLVVVLPEKKLRREVYRAMNTTAIPNIPTTIGPVHPMQFIYALANSTEPIRGKLEQLLDRWNPAFMIPFYNASIVIESSGESYNETISADAQTYLRQVRTLLEERLQMVNFLLSNEKFWTPKELFRFHEDTEFKLPVVKKAWNNANRQTKSAQSD